LSALNGVSSPAEFVVDCSAAQGNGGEASCGLGDASSGEIKSRERRELRRFSLGRRRPNFDGTSSRILSSLSDRLTPRRRILGGVPVSTVRGCDGEGILGGSRVTQIPLSRESHDVTEIRPDLSVGAGGFLFIRLGDCLC